MVLAAAATLITLFTGIEGVWMAKVSPVFDSWLPAVSTTIAGVVSLLLAMRLRQAYKTRMTLLLPLGHVVQIAAALVHVGVSGWVLLAVAAPLSVFYAITALRWVERTRELARILPAFGN
ncbi:MAG: hypothetical protein GMKNLPBB_02612 [Myxococcota bacterium]|nr:hypothetical protein [Myxococcota bacterium]